MNFNLNCLKRNCCKNILVSNFYEHYIVQNTVKLLSNIIGSVLFSLEEQSMRVCEVLDTKILNK